MCAWRLTGSDHGANVSNGKLAAVILGEASGWDHTHNREKKLEPISFLLAAHLMLIISCVSHHQLTTCWTKDLPCCRGTSSESWDAADGRRLSARDSRTQAELPSLPSFSSYCHRAFNSHDEMEERLHISMESKKEDVLAPFPRWILSNIWEFSPVGPVDDAADWNIQSRSR